MKHRPNSLLEETTPTPPLAGNFLAKQQHNLTFEQLLSNWRSVLTTGIVVTYDGGFGKPLGSRFFLPQDAAQFMPNPQNNPIRNPFNNRPNK